MGTSLRRAQDDNDKALEADANRSPRRVLYLALHLRGRKRRATCSAPAEFREGRPCISQAPEGLQGRASREMLEQAGVGHPLETVRRVVQGGGGGDEQALAATPIKKGQQREVRQVEPGQERRRIPDLGSHGPPPRLLPPILPAIILGLLPVPFAARLPGQVLGGKAIAGHQDGEESLGPVAARPAVGIGVPFPVLEGSLLGIVSVGLLNLRPTGLPIALALAPLIMLNHRHGAEQEEVAGQPIFSRLEGRLDMLLPLPAISYYSTRSSF